MADLNKEVWVPGIKENPVPNTSFVSASVDMTEYVDNNKIHLAEAGIEPGVHENYFDGNDDPLPIASVADIPSEVVLNTYSTEQTRHRDLQEVELNYKRKESVIGRHRTSLGKNMGQRAAYSWATDLNNEFNKTIALGNESIVDAIIDGNAFFEGLDKFDGLNICLSPEHMALIRKVDYKLYKELKKEPGMNLFGFKMWQYSQTPLFTDKGVKKPLGTVKEATDKRCSFMWASDEVFRCFGDTKMYSNIGDSGTQSDTISFGQRALVGKIRAAAPKYLATIY